MNLFKHKQGGWGSGAAPYVSPFLLEVLSTRPGAPGWVSATGSLTAEAPGSQVVSCSRASSGYCLGDDGLLHLLGSNTVRVEPTGLLVEGASTNLTYPSLPAAGTGTWTTTAGGVAAPTTTASSAVTDPTGGTSTVKIDLPTTTTGQWSWLYSQVGGAANQTGSIWLRTASGTATVYLIENTAGGPTTACNVTTTWQRFSRVTTSAAANNFVLGYGNFDVTNSYGSACTVYAWGAQFEALPFATSNIDTTSGTATRAADMLTVANPLAALSQPVATWRMGNWAQPLPGATWNSGGSANIAIFLANGVNAGVESVRLGIGSGYHTNGGGDVRTVGFNISAPGWADPNSGDALTALLMVASGFATTVPPADSEPVNVGQVNPFDASITLGSPVGTAGFRLQGHMRDIYVDNT